MGIPSQDLERIFDPFERTSRRGCRRGAGLGLAICARIVERHGGRIWAESRVGAGATFHVILPAHDEQWSPPAPTQH